MPNEIKIDEKKFNEIINSSIQKSVDSILESIGKKVNEIVDKKFEEKGFDKVDRSFFSGGVDKKEISKMKRSERFANFVKAVALKDVAQAKALSEGNDTEGGYLVPADTQAEILRVMEDYGIMRKLCRVITMKKDTKSVPRLSSSVNVYWPGENNAGTKSQPNFGNVILIAKTAVGICVTSNELLEDSDENIENLIIELFVEALTGEEDRQALVGTGAPFVGVLNDSDVTVLIMDSGDTDFADVDADYLRKMISYVKTSLLKGACFIMEKSVWAHIQTLKDSNGQYICSVANPVLKGTEAPVGEGLELVGYVWNKPVYCSDSMPDMSDTAVSTKFLVFGNFTKAFLFGDRKEVGIKISEDATVGGESIFESNQIAIRVTERIAMAIGVPEAFVALKTSAS